MSQIEPGKRPCQECEGTGRYGDGKHDGSGRWIECPFCAGSGRRRGHGTHQTEPTNLPSLTRIDELARAYATNYASPHHFTLSVNGLRTLMEEWGQEVRRQALDDAAAICDARQQSWAEDVPSGSENSYWQREDEAEFCAAAIRSARKATNGQENS
jgi:hypothetical protein